MSDAATVEQWSGKDRGDENFPVGSLLIRRDLRAHVHAFYAFARNADDIADAIYWVATRPAHVNVNVIQMMPVCQAFGPFAVARDESATAKGNNPK